MAGAEAEPRPVENPARHRIAGNAVPDGQNMRSNECFTFTTIRRGRRAGVNCDARRQPALTAARCRLAATDALSATPPSDRAISVHAMHSNKHFSSFSFITPNAPMSITTETDEVAVGLWPSADAAGAVAGHVTRRPSPAVLGIGRKNWLKTFATYHASRTRQSSTPCLERRRR